MPVAPIPSGLYTFKKSGQVSLDNERRWCRYHHLFADLLRQQLCQIQPERVPTLHQRAIEWYEEQGFTDEAIEILNLQALALQAQGDTNQAMATLERALTLAEPGGFVRTFVDAGPPMARLLYEALSRGIAPDYVRRLLSAFPVTEPEQAAPSETQASKSELIEPLSERELQALQPFAEGLTNREIASRLFLSLNTVKAHAGNIYGKLNVRSRTQAIARAQASGLLSPK